MNILSKSRLIFSTDLDPLLGSTGCQPVIVGSLPTTACCSAKHVAMRCHGKTFRQAAEKHRLVACAPRTFFCALLVSIAPMVCSQSTLAAEKIDSVAVAKEMAQSERNFSKKSSEVGIRESFIQFFADDSVYLSPGPVNGKKHYTEYKDKGYYLTWQPVFATVASSGDMGITTGPWEIKKSKTEQ